MSTRPPLAIFVRPYLGCLTSSQICFVFTAVMMNERVTLGVDSLTFCIHRGGFE